MIEGNIRQQEKLITELINDLSSEVCEVEQAGHRLYSIESRLQGSRPETITGEDAKVSSDNHISKLKEQIDRLREANRSNEDIITNIESIV